MPNGSYKDSVVANTKTDKRFFHTLGKGSSEKYFIGSTSVSKEFYLAEYQKQINEQFRPFKRIVYYNTGQLSLKGNFFHGDGLLDSCKSYYPGGILQYESKVTLDTLPPISQYGVSWPVFRKKTYSEKSYNKQGILVSHIYGDQTQKTEERYSNGKLVSTKTELVKIKK